MQRDLERAASWIKSARRIAVLTGAGISTESGIPDFRSPGGVWSRFRTVYFEEFLSSEQARHEYWVQKAEAHAEFAAAQPNSGHRVLAKWEQEKRIAGVITQNIDGLHQLAGNQQVLQLHGTAREISCLDCHHRWPADSLVAQFRETNQVPACVNCGTGRLKHATISFGQELPVDVLTEAYQWCANAEVMLAIGSSLVVYPAADLPLQAKQAGAKLIIINRDETGLDAAADVILSGSCGETLTVLDKLLR